ncbi:MAG: LON peptidase substrate-binding domain-containing protein [Acidobacteriota bacterium]
MAGRFDLSFEHLPPAIPIFPLTGVLLLPHGRMPLNVFEPRYLAMVSDALPWPRLIGMVQPLEGRGDAGEPPVYQIGCAGRIVHFSETEDGRYVIQLAGVARFQIAAELPMQRGYRLVRPDWSRFRADVAPPAQGGLDRERLLAALRPFLQRRNVGIDWDAAGKAPDDALVTTLAMACPFQPSEKQALLEADTLAARASLLTALLEMAGAPETEPTGVRH